MLTLRQIEVIRAIMVTGTIAGAAKMLGVSAPGISRLMKYSESSLGVRLFDRRGGRYVPTTQARDIFSVLDTIHGKIEDLQFAIGQLKKGSGQELRFGSVPSIANVMVPIAVQETRRRFPELMLEISILKIEETVDYLLLGRGEVVAMSSRFDHAIIDFEPLATGSLLCIVPADSALAGRSLITLEEMGRHPLIGIDPNDPYGSIMARLFERAGVNYRMTIKARFGTTVCSLVATGLGIAIIDEFTVAYGRFPGIVAIPIEADTTFHTYIALRNDTTVSVYAETLIANLRTAMQACATRSGGRPRASGPRRPRR